MPYTTSEARQQLLEELARAAQALSTALASLSEAYEQLDEQGADRLEADLFRPVQRAYGRLGGAYNGFAERHRLAAPELEQAARPAPAHGVKGLIEAAVADTNRADATLATLQDSLLPIEVGDSELRAGIAQVRERLAGSGTRARELMRRFGR